jgi:hypothetical protein
VSQPHPLAGLKLIVGPFDFEEFVTLLAVRYEQIGKASTPLWKVTDQEPAETAYMVYGHRVQQLLKRDLFEEMP